MIPPEQIAHYRIVAKLGEGGMGAVYRATDTKLNRDVAIKLLPAALAGDEQYMARFEREARVLASLNHPNIATIFGIEQGAIVMELVEGPGLAERIASGAIPLDEALRIAGQIADALEAAHERGVIHRDLKPANVRMTPAGIVKLLDFGLAKQVNESAVSASGGSATISPTLSLSMTQAGMILGTAAYMSPEQARGHAVDQRCDIWAFGVVLWEMLTGRQMFEGPTVSDVLAGVLKNPLELSRVPVEVRPVLAACLERDPRQRLRHMGDWRRLMAAPSTTPPASRKWPATAWFAVAASVLLATAAVFWRPARPPADRPLTMVDLDAGGELSDPAVSRDGQRVAFVVNHQLAIRDLKSREIRFLAGTDNAIRPFFSPDGRSLGYFAQGTLRTIAMPDGQPVVLCTVQTPRGGVWAENGMIYVSDRFGASLTQVPATGGKCENRFLRHEIGPDPQALPGGNLLLSAQHGLHVLSLASNESKPLLEDADAGRYLAQGKWLFYYRRSVIYAVRFDPTTLRISGNPVPVLDGIQPASSLDGAVDYQVAGPSGTLVYHAGNPVQQEIVWLEPDGRVTPLIAQPGEYSFPRLSPDGSRLAFTGGSGTQLFLYDIGRREAARLIAQQQRAQDFAVWSRDGQTIAMRADSLVSLNVAAGTKSPIDSDARLPYAKILPWSFAPDDSALLGFDALGTDRRLRLFPVEKTPAGLRYGAAQVLDPLPGDQSLPAISPDGKWVAFGYRPPSAEAGEIFVAPYRPGEAGEPPVKWQVSSAGGGYARWPEGGWIFFGARGYVMTAPYTVEGGVFRPGAPRRWSDQPVYVKQGTVNWDVTRDGKRVVGVIALGNPKPVTTLQLVLNIAEDLAARERAGK